MPKTSRPHRGPRGRRPSILGLASALLFCSCLGSGAKEDPTVLIESAGGSELGVSTEYGVVFLGRAARSGTVELTAWFRGGPSFERGVVETIGEGLFAAEAEIRLPTVELSFEELEPGGEVVVVGRRGDDPWRARTEVGRHPDVTGLLLRAEGELRDLDADQVGAGVYVERGGETRLVGLVSGSLRLKGEDGRWQSFVTAFGPQELWRLVTFRRDLVRPPRWVYREDVL